MNKYIVEFIGTFFLVLVIGTAGVFGTAGNLAPLAIGTALMVMVYAGGHISGAHYNPAVTIAVFLRGKCDQKDVGPYMGVQLLAAVVGSLAAGFLRGRDGASPMELDVMKALLAEFLFTFALVYVILNVATAKATSGNSYYGLAIGMTVLSGAYTVGDISGGAFNPAVAVALCLMGAASWSAIWIYLAGSIGGAVVAAMVFRMLNPQDH